MFNHQEKLNEPCQNCGNGPDWTLRKMVDSAGRERYPYACQHCNARTRLFKKKAKAKKVLGADDEMNN